jgi:hypothetical protein
VEEKPPEQKPNGISVASAMQTIGVKLDRMLTGVLSSPQSGFGI